MNEDQIKNIVDQRIAEKLSAYSNFTVPQHKHNGVDSLKLHLSEILPYNIQNNTQSVFFTLPGGIAGTTNLFDYSYNQIGGFNYYNWGMDIFIGNDNGKFSYSELNLADFYVDAIQTAPQTIPSSTPTTIIFDNDQNTVKPTGAYDTATGQFNVVKNTQGNFQTYSGWNTPGWYLVTASVGITPSSASSGESVDIIVTVDGAQLNYNRQYYQTATDPIVVTISVLLAEPITSNLHIDVVNNSANSATTVANGQVTYLKIKQLK